MGNDGSGVHSVIMLLYSFGLTLALTVSAPWWLFRMATTQRYREGLGQRLGRVPIELRRAVEGKRVVWLHAVSVGEVLAATRLVGELEAALGADWTIVISTTTGTGQSLAQQRFGAERVFYMPLDFAFAVRAYLGALHPAALVLMESELWPRMLEECSRRSIPVAVANARVSDRSVKRGSKLRVAWGRTLRKVSLWLPQSEEDGRRLAAMGARAGAIHVAGNLKYDIIPRPTGMLEVLRPLLDRRTLVVAGSLLEPEEELLVSRWWTIRSKDPEAVLLLAARHPERFPTVLSIAEKVAGGTVYRASALATQAASPQPLTKLKPLAVIVLDTIGDLAEVYSLATVAFVGGSLAPKGGHNPLEPAQYGVPVVIGPSFENFRDVVKNMLDGNAIVVVHDPDELEKTLIHLLGNPDAARALGERGRQVFLSQQGATARSVAAIVNLVSP